jgi:hypothetical protein
MTGQATSNVFDGQRVLGDDVGGMVMRGVLGQHNIGYLSYLEAMRYCEVNILMLTYKIIPLEYIFFSFKIRLAII